MSAQNSELENLLGERGGERRINYALDRFRKALESVGNPERDVYTIVTSGTNGKGTTSLYLSAALRTAGFEVMTYLSPHLQHPTERFLLNMVPIAEDELTELALEYRKTGNAYELSYFEYLTLLVFVWARKRRPQFLILEAGLGGRLDATNVTDPIACLLTNVGFDHMEYLGDTLEQILEEKLGTLRHESLFFTGVRRGDFRPD